MSRAFTVLNAVEEELNSREDELVKLAKTAPYPLMYLKAYSNGDEQGFGLIVMGQPEKGIIFAQHRKSDSTVVYPDVDTHLMMPNDFNKRTFFPFDKHNVAAEFIVDQMIAWLSNPPKRGNP